MFGYQLIRKSELDDIQTDLARATRKLEETRNLVAEMRGREETQDEAIKNLTQVCDDYATTIKQLTEDKKGLIDHAAAADDRAAEAKEMLDVLKQSIRVGIINDLSTLAIGLRSAWDERRTKKLAPPAMKANSDAIDAGITKVADLLDLLTDMVRRDKR